MDTQKTLSAIIETFIPSSLDESIQQIKALSLNDPPNLNYLANLILHKVIIEPEMAKEYAKLSSALQEIDVFKVVLVDNCKNEFEKAIDKHIRMNSRHQEFFMSITRGVLLNDEASDIEEENKLRAGTIRLCSFIAELFLLKVLASKAVCRCIDILLTANDDFSLDCLCTLLSTCGKQLEESLRKKGSEAMNFYFSSIYIVTMYNEKFNISNEVAYKARRLAALREMTWNIRVDVEKQVQKNQEAKEGKCMKKERERPSEEPDLEKDLSETDTNDKEEYCYREGRRDVTISPSTFPKREITKECPHKNEIMDIVMNIFEDLVEEKDFKRSIQYIESYFNGSEKKNAFLTKLILYVLDKVSLYRFDVGELLAELVKINFYQPHQMMQQLIFLFNESQHLLIDIPSLWYNIGELYNALIREEYITLPDLKAVIETAGFKRTESSANFVCNLLTVLRHNEGEIWVQLVAWDNSVMTLGDFIAPSEIRYYINRYELNYLVSRPSIVNAISKELNVKNVKTILCNYITLDEDKAFSRIYKWSQNHIGDKIETAEFLTALTLAICEFSSKGADSELDVEKLKRHCKILGCYVKDSPRSQKTCIEAVDLFVKESTNAQDIRAKIMSTLNQENVIPESLLIADSVSHDMDKLCLDEQIAKVNALEDNDVRLRYFKEVWKPARLNPNLKNLSTDEKKTLKLYKSVTGILNQLMEEKFEHLIKRIKNLPIDNVPRMQGVVDLIFDKAIDEPAFCRWCAEICNVMESVAVTDKETGKWQTFRTLLINKCQQEFERDKSEELDVIKKQEEINACTDPEKKEELQLLFEETERKVRRKSVGNCRFIGELFKLQMLTAKIMLRCINILLSSTDEESLECLCVLLTTIGKDLEAKSKNRSKKELDQYFEKMQDLSENEKYKVPSRIRFMLQDVIDLKKNNWVPRREVSHDMDKLCLSDRIGKDVPLRHSKDAWKPARLNPDLKNLSADEKKTQELYKSVTGILNQLMEEKFEHLINRIKNLPIDNVPRMQGVVDLIFDKAIDEPAFCRWCAEICNVMESVAVTDKETGKWQTFRTLLINKCQQEFERDKSEELDVIKKQEEINACTDPEKKEELQLLFEETERKVRRKSVGNCRFIGELFKLQMLTAKIMLRCINILLSSTDEESLECLCVLLTTIGKDLEAKSKNRSKKELDQYFEKMQDLSKNEKYKVPSRIRFMLQDVIDLRKNNWVPRREADNLKKIDQINTEMERNEELISSEILLPPHFL